MSRSICGLNRVFPHSPAVNSLLVCEKQGNNFYNSSRFDPELSKHSLSTSGWIMCRSIWNQNSTPPPPHTFVIDVCRHQVILTSVKKLQGMKSYNPLSSRCHQMHLIVEKTSQFLVCKSRCSLSITQFSSLYSQTCQRLVMFKVVSFYNYFTFQQSEY